MDLMQRRRQIMMGASPLIEMTATGNPAVFTSKVRKAYTSLKAGFLPVQDLHGYDNPWPAGGGKNLLDPSKRTSDNNGYRQRWYKEDGYTLKANTTYTFSVQFNNPIALYIIDHATTTDIVTGNSPLVYTPTEDTLVYIQAYRSEDISSVDTFQLEIGSTATAYTPYSNICPITGWDGVKVTRTGKNLLNASACTDGYYISVSGVILADSTSMYSDLTPVKTGAYVLSLKNNDSVGRTIRIHGYDAEGMWLQQITSTNIASGQKGSVLINVPSSVANVRISMPNSATEIQLELGSTATAYEPYTGNTYSIAFPTEAGTVYGGTLDVSTGELVVDRAMVDLPTGNPTIIGTYSDRKDVGWNLPQKKVGSLNVMSQAFKTESVNGVPPIVCVAGRNANTYVTFGVPIEHATNEATAGAYIRGLSPTIVYELATPLTYTLTAQQIQALFGTNTVFSDANDDVEVKYLTRN